MRFDWSSRKEEGGGGGGGGADWGYREVRACSMSRSAYDPSTVARAECTTPSAASVRSFSTIYAISDDRPLEHPKR